MHVSCLHGLGWMKSLYNLLSSLWPKPCSPSFLTLRKLRFAGECSANPSSAITIARLQHTLGHPERRASGTSSTIGCPLRLLWLVLFWVPASCSANPNPDTITYIPNISPMSLPMQLAAKCLPTAKVAYSPVHGNHWC